MKLEVFSRCESIPAVRLARKIRVCTLHASEVSASGGSVVVLLTGDGPGRPKYSPCPPGWPSCACKVSGPSVHFFQCPAQPNDNRGTVVSTVEAAALLQVTAQSVATGATCLPAYLWRFSTLCERRTPLYFQIMVAGCMTLMIWSR